MKFFLCYKNGKIVGGSNCMLITDEFECREVTKEQYEEYQAEQDKKRQRTENLLSQIKNKKELLQKYKEDIEQVNLFGMERDDYEEKKELCKNLVLELRELEKSTQHNPSTDSGGSGR